MSDQRKYARNNLYRGILFFTMLTFLSSCNLPSGTTTPTKAPDLVFPTAPSTAAPLVITATNTASSAPLPTSTTAPAATFTSLPPTPNIPPTSAPTAIIPNPVRVNFETGATTGIVEKTIHPGEIQNFLVGASQNQPLMISTSALNNDVTFAVIGLKDGKTLVRQTDKTSSWQTMLTVTQDYLIQVFGGGSKEKYTLDVSTPARVYFDPGAISASRSGSTPGGYTVSYVLRANAGQQMDLSLTAPAGDAVLAMYGYQDGNPYLRYVVEQTTFSMKLPSTEDYIIQVVPRAGAVVSYTLNINIK